MNPDPNPVVKSVSSPKLTHKPIQPFSEDVSTEFTKQQEFEYNNNKKYLVQCIFSSTELLSKLFDYLNDYSDAAPYLWTNAHFTKNDEDKNVIKEPRLFVLDTELDIDVERDHMDDVSSKIGEISSRILRSKLSKVIRHLQALLNRVEDTSSKVLITGDLNAGKSTLCNSLVRRKILPEDQQPCTEVFCEVLDSSVNGNQEAVHAIAHNCTYSVSDPKTYTVFPISALQTLVYETDNWGMLKVYIDDGRPACESLLHNGIMDVALIDAPGLNTDSMKTTSVFACQEEIDVIVFVVNAENHFTLSATEFLRNASVEKSHIFIVVNKFDNIRDKQRCKRIILSQIEGLSRETYNEADDLIHFISCKSLQQDADSDFGKEQKQAFSTMESALRSFILENRSKSKLAPVRKYLMNLTADCLLISEKNLERLELFAEKLSETIDKAKPQLEETESNRSQVLSETEELVESTVNDVSKHTRVVLQDALDSLDTCAHIKYPGFLFAYQYALQVRDNMRSYLQEKLILCEDFSREQTTATVQRIHSTTLKYFPNFLAPRFKAKNMFAKTHKLQLQKHFVFDIDILDFIDLDVTERIGTWGASLSTLGLLLGRYLLSYASVTGVALPVISSLQNINPARLFIPVAGLSIAAFLAYIIHDIPRALPMKLSRKIHRSLRRSDFTHNTSVWLSLETRKVLGFPLEELRRLFQQQHKQQTQRLEEATRDTRMCKYARDFFTDMKNRATNMERRLSNIQLEGCIIKY
ncbi:fusion GTPase [Schizosaccharomyces japonicus yFS275]|uniref:Fusion GTPase n=1 Tax=Schizosaccharomyces japonicus (strain yFS275 / FY16936) TaxID=402676 RepID=B6JUT7_SCHJY|nr:fusion GTPase [Schizosaccharomyces japonicus yFS275]EEB05039.1 fusion GTPase [Schizosaccharomyces japonicus yFS275]